MNDCECPCDRKAPAISPSYQVTPSYLVKKRSIVYWKLFRSFFPHLISKGPLKPMKIELVPIDVFSSINDYLGLVDLFYLYSCGSSTLNNTLLRVKSASYTPNCIGKLLWPTFVSSLTSLVKLKIAFLKPYIHRDLDLGRGFYLPASITDVHFAFGNANIFASTLHSSLPNLQTVYLNGSYSPRLEMDLGPNCTSFSLVGFSSPLETLPSSLTSLNMDLYLPIQQIGLLPRSLTHLHHLYALDPRPDPENASESPPIINWPPDLQSLSFRTKHFESELIQALPMSLTRLSVMATGQGRKCFPPKLTSLELRASEEHENLPDLISSLPIGLKRLYLYQGRHVNMDTSENFPASLTSLDLSMSFKLSSNFLNGLHPSLTVLSGCFKDDFDSLPPQLSSLRSAFLPLLHLTTFPQQLTTIECNLSTIDLCNLPSTLLKLQCNLDVPLTGPRLWVPLLPRHLTDLSIFMGSQEQRLSEDTTSDMWPQNLQKLRTLNVFIPSLAALPCHSSLTSLKVLSCNSKWDPETVGMNLLPPNLTKLVMPDLPLDDEDVHFLPKRLSILEVRLRLSEAGCRALPRSIGSLGRFHTRVKFDANLALPPSCRCRRGADW